MNKVKRKKKRIAKMRKKREEWDRIVILSASFLLIAQELLHLLPVHP